MIKQNVIYPWDMTMGFYSEIKRNKLLIPATTWINLKYVMLSEKAGCKRKYCMCPFI